MTNEILFFICVAATFTAVAAASVFLGKDGLFGWAAVAPVLANLLVSRQINLFGMAVTMGNILFASLFLCTDILSEVYGAETSKKAVAVSVGSELLFIGTARVSMLFHPNDLDTITPALAQVFQMSARVTAASVLMFALANLADVYLFEAIRRRVPNALWLRNNVATILCNCTENFLFTALAFYGVYPIGTCVSIAASTSVVEAVIAVCDTPFLYASRRHSRKR